MRRRPSASRPSKGAPPKAQRGIRKNLQPPSRRGSVLDFVGQLAAPYADAQELAWADGILEHAIHSHRCEPRVHTMPVCRARWGTCGDQPSGSPVDQSAPTVAFYQRQWLPEAYGLANLLYFAEP